MTYVEGNVKGHYPIMVISTHTLKQKTEESNSEAIYSCVMSSRD